MGRIKKIYQTTWLKKHTMNLPSCTTYKQFKEWLEACAPSVNIQAGFCEDCLPEYQRKMGNKGKCDHPDVLFFRDDNGLIYGTHPVNFEDNPQHDTFTKLALRRIE